MRRLLCLPVALCLGLAAAPPAAAGEFHFARLDRTYTDLVREVPGYESGPLRLRLSSPRQVLTLRGHRLALTPGGDGSYRALLEASFFGKGVLVADVEIGGVAQRLEDELIVPPQRLEVPARVRVRREAGGWRFTALELPARLVVEIRSRLGNQIVALCEGAALLSFGQLDCGGVESLLNRVDLPLPGPGGEFFLPLEEVSAEERQALDGFLGTRPPA